MKRNVNYGKRGKQLEIMIDMTNQVLKNKDVADIRKVPTPVNILNVRGNRITGHLEKPTWVDYSGVYKGQAIIFDAKETKLKSFPLNNLQEHQYRLLHSWHNKGAMAFLVVAFWNSGNEPEAYLLHFEILKEYWEAAQHGARKSIPIKAFKEKCIRLKSQNGYLLDYITAIDTLKQREG